MTHNTRNIAIAAAITACARLRLYEAMEKAGEQLCYVDTDSCIYEDDGKVDIKITTKPQLGEWELEDDIEEFVAIGPKSYAYKTPKGVEIAKCKGFSTDWITFDKYDQMVKAHNTKHVYEDLNFKRTPAGIRTQMLVKELSFVFDKRTIIGVNTTPLILAC